ncbi:hypothetical protein C8F01DRAFT_102830 [Mycena amicta]|nr:hypothetical protein C8F01DRAFT_102830 [Mycena amicta]
MPDLMYLSLLVSNTVLAAALCAAYSDTIIAAAAALYSGLRELLNPGVLLVVYGLLLLYLFAAVAALKTAVAGRQPPAARDKYLPGYDENGNLLVWVRRKSRHENGSSERLGNGVTHPVPMFSAPADNCNDFDFSSYKWNGWPDGFMKYRVTNEELARVGNLAIFWALETLSSGRRGSLTAQAPEKGRLYNGKCYGVLVCEAARCSHQLSIAPQTDPRGIARQLGHPCLCGQRLRHVRCGVECSASVFRSGVVFQHNGKHTHAAYTHSRRGSSAANLVLAQLDETAAVPFIPARARPQPVPAPSTADADYEGGASETEREPPSRSRDGISNRVLQEPHAESENTDWEAEQDEINADPNADQEEE